MNKDTKLTSRPRYLNLLWRWSPIWVTLLSCVEIFIYRYVMNGANLDTLRETIGTWYPLFILYTLVIVALSVLGLKKTVGWRKISLIALMVFNIGFLCLQIFLYSIYLQGIERV